MGQVETSRLLTVAEVAERLGQSPLTVRRKIRRGVIPAVKLGKAAPSHLRVDERELEAWLFDRELEASA